ncbi:hypothetical protein PsorP6_010963 [Peronosclerospora sorghi]|uniref:Uncharacterized protein n=1 Tax=Peronosclerospora sorghi TaxID=230839 RepID=A0ACC0VWZ8_9STRA|nr:hypothetical protein PsorP6_010963 [Peronosclerospora sorghi]
MNKTDTLTACDTFAQNNPSRISGKELGGPHRKYFFDTDAVVPGMKVRSVSILGAERIDAMRMTIVKPNNEERNFRHGGDGGPEQTWSLDDDEFIKRI